MKINIAWIGITILLCSCSPTQKVTQGYIEGEYTYVAAPSSGYLSVLKSKRGSQVKLGDLMFQLQAAPDNWTYEQAKANRAAANANLANLQKGDRPSEIDALQAQLNQAEAQLKLSDITWQRQKDLLKKGYTEKQRVDELYAKLLVDKARVAEIQKVIITANLTAREDLITQAKNQLNASVADQQKARWYLSKKSQKAPKAGIIFDTFYVTGEWVTAGQPVLALLAPEDVHVIFFVPEVVMSQLQIGASINFNCDSCQHKTTAVIDYISPQAEYTPPVIYSNTNNANLVYRVKALLPADIALQFHPGQPVVVNYHG